MRRVDINEPVEGVKNARAGTELSSNVCSGLSSQRQDSQVFHPPANIQCVRFDCSVRIELIKLLRDLYPVHHQSDAAMEAHHAMK